MSIKHSLASKARWAKMSDEAKAERMSAMSRARWNKTTKEERVKVGKFLVNKRKEKHGTTR